MDRMSLQNRTISAGRLERRMLRIAGCSCTIATLLEATLRKRRNGTTVTE
jgi:hypothetical protein